MKNFLHILRERATLVWRWLVRRDIPTYLLFVVMATAVWWGRAMSSPRETNIVVPVVYTEIPEQVAFDTPLPDRLRVTIQDTGKRLRQISSSKPELVVDLSTYLVQEEGAVHISTEVLRPRLQDMLPGSTVVQQVLPEAIDAKYHKDEEKTVEVRLAGRWRLAQQYQMTEMPTIEPQQVVVYGKKSTLATLREIKTEPFQISDLRDTMQYKAALVLPDGVRAVPSVVTVTLATEQFTEKSFTLPVETVGNEEEKESLLLFPHEVTLQARVGMSKFADVKAEDFAVQCHYPKEGQETIPVEVVCTNAHVTKWRVNPSELEYIIKR